ncbi:MAG: hypothetical protein HRS50_00985, partial [Mycoplasmataceae bacterium]|nr:hypothetical protein [Mycoplasmataceae bacterium]
MNINKRIEFLIKKAKFNLTEEEKIKFYDDLIKFQESLKIFYEFNLENIIPSNLPFHITSDNLRED